MLTDQFQNVPDREEAARREVVVNNAGALLAHHFLSVQSPQLLLDMDGVILQSDSLDVPKLTTLDVVPTLQLLEAQGVSIGPATGRGMHAVNFLRNQGLKFSGPAILEEGQVIVQNGIASHLGHPNHEKFINTVRATMEHDAECLPTWNDVQEEVQSGKFAFSPGNFQWQGTSTAKYWFQYIGEDLRDSEIISTKFQPRLQTLASQAELDYDRDVELRVYRMQPSAKNGNLAIITVKGKLDGKIIDKGVAAKRLSGTWGFVADGFGDTPLAKISKIRSGVVIGIEGNLDITKDAPEFLNLADIVLRSPTEFTKALRHAVNILRSRFKEIE